MYDLKENLHDLLSLPGLSAFEDPVRSLISKTWEPMLDELSVSPLGSLHGLKKGTGKAPRPSILLAAHMDAIGLMVSGIDNGFLRFTEIGGIDDRILPGTQVVVHGKKDVEGVVVLPRENLMPDDAGKGAIEKKHLFIDVGLLPDDVKKLIQIGDPISFAQKPFDLPNDVICGHTLDNRASVAAVTVCLDELNRLKHAWDVWAVATVQEEETLGGGFTSPYAIRPDLAVAIDVTFAKGPGSSDFGTFQLGKGITLGIGSNVHPGFYKSIKQCAERHEIPVHAEIMPNGSGTDAIAMQVVADGITTLVMGIPLRYMHTAVEVVHLQDIRRAGRLLAAFISELPIDYMNTLTWED